MKKNNILTKISAALLTGLMISSTLIMTGCNIFPSGGDNTIQETLVDGYNFGIGSATFTSFATSGTTKVLNLKTSGLEAPLSLDTTPVFTWELHSNVIGRKQTAYEITLKKGDEIVWDSGKVRRPEQSITCPVTLEAKTKYTWSVKVYDEKGKSHLSEEAYFQTGLLNDKINAWTDGKNTAEWIGNEELSLNSHSLSIFNGAFDFQVSDKDKFGFIFGANDLRLQYAPYNTFLVASDDHYIMLRFDFSTLSETKGATYEVIRRNYCTTDVRKGGDNVLYSGEIPTSIISVSNYTDKHSVKFTMQSHAIYTITIDGQSICSSRIGVSPYVSGTSSTEGRPKFPVLGDIGFYADGTVDISGLTISNVASPGGTLYSKDVGATYSIYEGKKGVSINGDVMTFTDTLVTADPSSGSATYLRNTFDIAKNKTIASANLYLCARGVYEYYINGEKVVSDTPYYTDSEGNTYYDNYFNPGSSEYWDFMYYSAYDVKDMLSSGKNAMGAILSSGWWTDDLGYQTTALHNYWGDNPALLSMLEITYTDGTKTTIISDTDSWKSYNDGPILYSSFLNGEIYDSSKEKNVEGFSTVNYDDSKWTQASVVKAKDSYMENPRLIGRRDEPVHVFEVVEGEYLSKETRKGHSVYTFNMGTNMVGIPEIILPEMPEGVKVVIRVGEILYPHLPDNNKYNYGDLAGLILTENYRGAMCLYTYVTSGADGGETYIPSFSFTGYQYIEISFVDTPVGFNADEVINKTIVKGRVLSTITELTSTYETDNSLANQLFENIQRSTIGNHVSIPTDCNQRNERLGWTGDINVYSQTASYIANVTPIYISYFETLRSTQKYNPNRTYMDWSPHFDKGLNGEVSYNPNAMGHDCVGWPSAGLRAPYSLYKHTGDIAVLEEHWNSMVMFIDAYANNVASEYGYEYLINKKEGSYDYGDWLSLQDVVDIVFVHNAYYGHCLQIMAEVAGILGYDSDLAKYTERYQGWFDEFNNHMIKDGFPCSLTGEKFHVQTAYATAIDFGLVSSENLDKFVANYVNLIEHKEYGVTSGFLGTASLLPALAKNGQVDTAYAMFENTEYAGWLYPVTQGATSIWERWNSFTLHNGFKNNNSMNSFNHYSLGAVGTWMLGYQAGIYAGDAGYSDFVLQPQQGGEFKFTSATFDSTYGKIKSEWTSDGEGNLLTYECAVPANTTATLYLDVNEGALYTFEEIKGVKYEGMVEHNGVRCAKFTLISGGYRFEVVKGEQQNKLCVRYADNYFVE